MARRALLLGFGVVVLCPLSGCFAMLNYTDKIFAESGSNLEPKLAAIIVGAIQFIGVSCSANLIDRFGRKVIIINFIT